MHMKWTGKRHKISKYLSLACFLMTIHATLALHAQSDFETRWSKTASSLTVFQPGDAVRIQIWELYEEERRNLNLSNDYPINADGYIIMPLIGEVKVKGLTAYELMQYLEERFRAYLRNPFVYVRPLIRVTMQGAFNRPGSYRVDPASSLWDLVALADGPDRGCDLEGMWVERGGKVVIDELLNSFEKGYSLEDVGIESGDQIMAPHRAGLNFGLILSIINVVTSVVLLYLRLRYRW
jgi:protein involved in polysaccharide export with SLBB domain